MKTLTDKGIAAMIELKAMEEANLERDEQGLAHAYGSEAFFELCEELKNSYKQPENKTIKKCDLISYIARIEKIADDFSKVFEMPILSTNMGRVLQRELDKIKSEIGE